VTEPPPADRPSGLRDPAAAARGLGAAMLAMEGVGLLLAIQPMRVLGGDLSDAAIVTVCGLAAAAFTLAALMRGAWAWPAAGGLQALLVGAGLLHWSLGILGVVFGLVWLYVSRVRRTLLRPPGGPATG
jgi:hypothetical protein